MVNESDYVTIARGAEIILGQKQMPYIGRPEEFDAKQSFSGRVSQLFLWRGEIVAEEVRSLSKCKVISREGIVIDWRMSDFRFGSDGVDVVQVEPAYKLCSPDPAIGVALFNIGAPKRG